MKNTSIAISFLIVALSGILTVFLFPILPNEVILDLNLMGASVLGKEIFILFPLLIAVIFAFLVLFPGVSFLQKKIEKIGDNYDDFSLLIVLNMFYIHGLILVSSLGFEFNMLIAIIPVFVCIFCFLGGVFLKMREIDSKALNSENN